MKKALSFFLLCLFVFGVFLFPAWSEAIGPQVENITFTPWEHSLPPRDEQGYLDWKAFGENEFVYQNPEDGHWLYLSSTLQVEITRFKGKYKRKPIIWYESQIHSKDENFRVFSADPEQPAKKLLRPELIAQKHKVVYAQNGDFFTFRTEREKRPGIIIRSGQILFDKTNRKVSKALPPLDELSFYQNGLFELHHPGELSAQDYIAKGAHDVVAFGPILINNGEIDQRLTDRYTAREPRSALGMVTPGHYVGFYIEARNQRSYGCDLALVAQRMKEKNCRLAINLDGGQTAAMVFMGEPVMQGGDYNGYTNTRRQQDVIGIGLSEQVKEFTP